MEQFWCMCRGFIKRWGYYWIFCGREGIGNKYLPTVMKCVHCQCCWQNHCLLPGFTNCRFWERPSRVQWHTMLWLSNNISHSVIAKHADELIWNEQWIILRKLCNFKLSVPKGSVNNVVVAFGYSKVCAQWFPWSVNDCHKTVWKKMCFRFCVPSWGWLWRLFVMDHHWEWNM